MALPEFTGIAHNCSSFHLAYPDPSTHLLTIVLSLFYYSFLFVLGLIGNLYIIILTLRHKSLQTVQNLFILNLAAADVILCVLSVPITPLTNIYKQWYFGANLCNIFGGLQAIAVFISTYSLCAISLDRYYRLVIKPQNNLTRRHAITATILIWTFSIALTLPYVTHMELQKYPGICGEFCTERWEDESQRKLYTLTLLILQAVVPFIIMALSYSAIFRSLHSRATSRILSIQQQVNLLCMLASTAGNAVTNDPTKINQLVQQKEKIIGQKKKITIILVSMVMIFALSSLPLNVISLVTELEGDLGFLSMADGTNLTYLCSLVVHALAMVVCLSNPLLYSFLNPEFREMVIKSLNCIPKTLNMGGPSMYYSQTEFV
uniref:G_PROTEIN_RECEP_F1_2 domain-containing protein n=1 Tax=Rhabditophanes sp. KR3021 TaxID=114890 RepID=A0AC35TZJ4_9BILA